MKRTSLWGGALVALMACAPRAQSPVLPARVQFITVAKDVKLEVVDWGGSGRPVVLLAGNGNTAHAFDEFAPKLTPAYHVYGITRRGFGASSASPSDYMADRLADDVLAVIDTLRLERPVLAGHSLAGQELSSIGSRHPEKVAGLIYLDAAYQYAFYDLSKTSNYQIDLNEFQTALAQMRSAAQKGNVEESRRLITQLVDTNLPAMDRALRKMQTQLPAASANPRVPLVPPRDPLGEAIMAGMQRYTNIRAPVLAIYASSEPTPVTEAFARGVPAARIVLLRNANHFVFRSNEADVLREMRAFIDALPRPGR